MTNTLELASLRAVDLDTAQDDLLNVYADVYRDRLADSFFSLSRYWERLEAYAARDGFNLVMGYLDGKLIGYALGFSLPAGSGWWRGLLDHVDPAVTVEDGTRTFALTEIMVIKSARRHGYARALHDALLADRQELRATLLVLPDNVPAQSAYLAWGWYRLGSLKPFDDSPTYDAMIRDAP